MLVWKWVAVQSNKPKLGNARHAFPLHTITSLDTSLQTITVERNAFAFGAQKLFFVHSVLRRNCSMTQRCLSFEPTPFLQRCEEGPSHLYMRAQTLKSLPQSCPIFVLLQPSTLCAAWTITCPAGYASLSLNFTAFSSKAPTSELKVYEGGPSIGPIVTVISGM